VVEFSRSGHEKQNKAASGKKNWNIKKMTFTGTLIESLMATVERAEQRASSDEPMFAHELRAEHRRSTMARLDSTERGLRF
jgi:hypothetical protein